MEFGRHPRQIAISAQVGFEAARGGRRLGIRQATAVEVVALGKAVGVDDRLVPCGHHDGEHVFEHAGGKLGSLERGMVGGPLHEAARGRDERFGDRELLRDWQGIAVTTAGGQHHPHPGGPHPLDG